MAGTACVLVPMSARREQGTSLLASADIGYGQSIRDANIARLFIYKGYHFVWSRLGISLKCARHVNVFYKDRALWELYVFIIFVQHYLENYCY